MPHYKDGTPARIGDFVKGPGYNTKENCVVGIVVSLNPDPFNISIVHMAFVAPGHVRQGLPVFPVNVQVEDRHFETRFLQLKVEYGLTNNFEKIVL